MDVIACDQFAVLGEGCPVCGGWLWCNKPDGTPGEPVPVAGGMTVCSTPECAEHERERVATFEARRNQ